MSAREWTVGIQGVRDCMSTSAGINMRSLNCRRQGNRLALKTDESVR